MNVKAASACASAVGVDVDPVDRVGVEFRAGHGRGEHERVGVDDQHRLVRVV
ncbi:MAG TPA: hypothetical protein VIV12_29935 [Streptosporangiaceae bacterium]